ncbi:MAG: hypothetical protein A3D31_03325 [Candidatus Fluviicola riflensis]|nr:MAG: hypothetical protein CHH17_11705 [Candidatus Fluviicola riflensis]OGS79014.1 MAG: hypothetical protein A3D31_03325 [Candidatus Fluviicola riflensis]OGS86037.1 MAG: hypothetical protein A3E30_10815 [Fluviicola sp. RIFCSPHIGHO2_12_FULL_43_24]OGS86446.1 MAG: hypothetical protein A2724_02785 [Fluviicola sp. RIFCSPHIGHO2_01_FULL_43_53]
MSFFKSVLTLLLLLTTTVVNAQVYPVQVSVSTTPPYYNFLSHYGDQNNHLLIIATLTDFNAPPVNVRLRLKIEGQGYVVQTRTDVPVGNVFQLTAGFPVFIQGSDVLPLLQENALTALSGNPDLNNLLEGFTTICVEVVEDNANGAVLATNNCTAFFLQLMQPPQAFLPVCNSVVDTSAMFQTFQWSPPQNYIPSIGTDLNYTFSLYEWIDTTNFTIFQSGQGLVYQTQTTFPMVQVSNFDLAWQQGVKYVWRVQAQLTSNGVPVQMITNSGLSTPCAFYYGKPQTLAESLSDGLVINVTAQGVSSRKGLASWTVIDETPNAGLSAYNRYLVEFRPTSLEGETWTWWPDTVSGFQFPIYRLIPERAYEVRVSGIAGNFMSEPSAIATFTTPAVREYACGEADIPYLPTQYQPLLSAHMGDVFQIGQFALEVTDILPLGQAGHFKGRGTIPHGFLGGARIKVKFDDLLVDREYNVREGMASAITDGVDNWLNDQYLDQAGVDTTLAGIIESGGFLNDSTVFVVVGGDSLFFTFNGELPIVIHGGDNVEYQFWPDGTMIVTTYGVTPSNDNLDATKNLVVHFEPASNDPSETATFDKKAYSQFSSGYEAIICQTGSPDQFIYFVPNKSKALTGTAQVKAVVHVNTVGFLPAGLTFQLAGSNTTISRTQLNDSTYLLTLPQSATSYTVYAMYEGLKLGKLSVKSYEPITKKVTIVPLVAMSINEAQIETELNKIYKGANLTIDAMVAPQFNTSVFTTTTQFANPDVNVMSKYTAQMRALRDAYLADHELESGTYLMFVVPSFSNSQLDGYMVRGRGVGFLAQSTLTSGPTFAHTVAHELGHGLGALQHAWGETESLKSTTDNLMDYSESTHLIKQQWEGLRNPAPFTVLFDNDEDGMAQNSFLGVRSELLTTVVDYDEIFIHNYAGGDQFIYRAQNGTYFKLGDTNYLKLNSVYLRNGFIIGGKYGNTQFELCNTYYDFALNQHGKTVFFYSDEIENRFEDVPASNGDTITLINPHETDIRQLEIIPCSQVTGYLADLYDSNLPNVQDDSLIFLASDCPPQNAEAGNCNTTYYQTINNLDRTAMREHVASFVSGSNLNYTVNPIKAFKFSSNEVFNYFSPKEELVIKEKVKALQLYQPDVVVGYILTENLDTDKLFSTQQLNELAQDAVQYALTINPNKKLAILVLNIPKYQQSGEYTQHENCYTLGFAVSDPSMIKPGSTVEDIFGTTSMEAFHAFFSLLKKPCKIINVHERFNGELVVNTIDRTAVGKEVYGSPFVLKANYVVSNFRNEYIQKVAAIGTANQHYENGIQNPSNASSTAQEQLLAEEAMLVTQAENALATSITEWQSLESLTNKDNWNIEDVEVYEMMTFFENLKESYITEDVVMAEVKQRKSGDLEWLSTINLPANPTSIYYEYDDEELVDNIIYGLIDILGCIPLVDYVADCAGVLYSSIRGNGTNVAIYSTALATPFVGAAVYKQGEKAVAYFTKKVDNVTYQLTAKNLDEVLGAEWVKISDNVPVKQDKLTQALTDLNSSENLQKFSQADRKAAYDYAKANADEVIEIVRGVSKNDYIQSVYDFRDGTNSELADLTWELWKDEEWTQIENIFRSNNINYDASIDNVWPPMSGFRNLNGELVGSDLNDELFDRFQKENSLGGSFASPVPENQSVYSLQSRALGVNYDDLSDLGQEYYYFKFKIVNAPNDLTFKYGEAAPWFNEIGGAVQVKSSTGFHNLTEHIQIVEKWKFINGQWIQIL